MTGRRTTKWKRWLAPAALAVLALPACGAAPAAQQFALKDGETVIFYGDSITAQRLYTKDVEEFVLSRYPEMHVRFVNAGVPGDTAAGGYTGTMAARVARDVVPYEPGMITVMLGMNDGGWGYGSPVQIEIDFQNHYKELLRTLGNAAPTAAITLICPTPYDEITHGSEFPGYSQMVDRLSGNVSQIGAQLQASSVQPIFIADFHRPLVEALEQAKAGNPQLAPLLIPDRIHPGPAGHWIMAAALMSAWHVNPVVSNVALNAAEGRVTESDRTDITRLLKTKEGLDWTQLDEALPLPLDFNDAMTAEVLRISSIATLDQQLLRVGSLAGGQYQLSIDGKPEAVFSGEELQHGINLALYKTPMLDQARDMASLEDQRAKLDEAGFILRADVKSMATTGIAEATLRAAQDQLNASIRKDLNPAPHHYVLSRVPMQPSVNGSGAHR